MSKVIGLTDYILLGAAFAADLFVETRAGMGHYRGALKNRYGYVPENYKKSSYFTTVSKLLKTGHIEKEVKEDGTVNLILTSKGKNKLGRRLPLAFKNKKWDGRFMVVIFDIEEEDKVNRNRFRNKLINLGFGMLQKSVWISPYHFEEDMREFVEEEGLSEQVFILNARQIWAGNFQKLAKRVWKLEEINNLYKQIVENANTVIKSDNQDRQIVAEIHELFLETLSKDPMLPEEILPDDWERKRAVKAVEMLK